MLNSAGKSTAAFLSEQCSAPDLLQALLDVSLTAINLFRPIFGPGGKEELIDFHIEYLNPAGQAMVGLPERPDVNLLSSFPQTKENGVFEFYRRVFLTGEPGRFNVHYQQDGLNNFYHLSARRCEGLLLVSFSDTSYQNRSTVEEALRESQAREKRAKDYADLQRQQLYNILMQAPALICIFEGPNHVFKLVNPPYQQLVGDRPLLGKPIAEAMPELAGQPIFGLLDKVYRTGESFYAHEMLVQLDHDNSGGDLGENYYNFIYQATHNLSGEIDGILVFAYEVTAQVKARRLAEYSHHQGQILNEELEARVAERTRQVQRAQAETERQRQRLERLFMQAPAAICILNGPNLVYELVNPAYQQLFPGRQLLDKPVLEALPEIEHHAVYSSIRDVYNTGITHEALGLLIPITRPEDGVLENRYFNFIVQARYNAKGMINGVLIFAFEVTIQVAARQDSEASAQQLQLITDSLPVLISYIDKEKNYKFVNKAFEVWFSQKTEDIINQSVRQLVGEEAYVSAEKYIEKALTGEQLDFEARMPYRQDLVKYIRASYVPDRQAGEVQGFYALVSDVTEQVLARQAVEASEQQAQALAEELAKTNDELRVANQQLIRTNVDLDNFIYTASHDLKAPILNIEGLMEALLEQLPPESLESEPIKLTTDFILDSVQRFKRTLNHLTEITKLQKENNKEAWPVNLAAVIADVQLDLAPAFQAAQATLELDILACPTIRFSEKNLRSVVYNLISNAIKYRSPERPVRVKVHCYETSDYQVLSVEDNGLGIDLTQEHKLFGMFKRLHNHVEGSGIGLYMVKKIIENAGGKIEVKSRVGEGSLFAVYFSKSC